MAAGSPTLISASNRHVRKHGPVRQWIVASNGWHVATYADGTAMAFGQWPAGTGNGAAGRWYRAPGPNLK